MATTTDDKTIYVDITIGVVVILVGAIVYTGRILYKRRRRRRRRRKDSESVLEPVVVMEGMNTESPPKKTAADHLGELKEVTQKVLQPLRKSSSFSSPRENVSTVLSSERSSVSLKNNTRRDNNKISTLKDSLMFKPFKVPPPPPPSPLRNDDFKVEPIRLSLLNLLLTNESTNTSSSISSPIIDSSSDLSFPTGTNSKNDSFHSLRKTLSKSQPDFNNLSRTITTPRETNLKEDSLRKTLSKSQPDFNKSRITNIPRETNLKEDSLRKTLSKSQPDFNKSRTTTIPRETNLKKDPLRKTLSKSQTDLNNSLQTTTLPRETNSKKNLLRKSISKSQPDLKDLSRQKLPQFDLTSPPKVHSKKGPLLQSDLTPSSRTIPQLNSSETRYKWDLTQTTPTTPKLDPKVQSRRSNRQAYSRNKETNDYSNFQPIQNIKPVQNVQNAQSEKTGKITKIVETDEVEELTLSPMYRIVKPVLKKVRQDDEIILDATLE